MFGGSLLKRPLPRRLRLKRLPLKRPRRRGPKPKEPENGCRSKRMRIRRAGCVRKSRTPRFRPRKRGVMQKENGKLRAGRLSARRLGL